MTTTNLSKLIARRPRWVELSPPVAAALAIFILLALASVVGKIHTAAQAAAVPTPALIFATSAPVIIIQKEHAPTTLPLPTPDMALRQEVEQLRARVAELEQQAAAPAPEVIEQPAQVVVVNAPAPAVATPTEGYTVANTGDFYSTPPHVDPAAQQALIGSDPSGLACGGSPLCGGLTNAEAQAAIDAQRAAGR